MSTSALSMVRYMSPPRIMNAMTDGTICALYTQRIAIPAKCPAFFPFFIFLPALKNIPASAGVSVIETIYESIIEISIVSGSVKATSPAIPGRNSSAANTTAVVRVDVRTGI